MTTSALSLCSHPRTNGYNSYTATHVFNLCSSSTTKFEAISNAIWAPSVCFYELTNQRINIYLFITPIQNPTNSKP